MPTPSRAASATIARTGRSRTVIPTPRPLAPVERVPESGRAAPSVRPAGGLGGEPGWEPRWALPWDEPLPAAYLALAQDYARRTTLFPGWRELLVDRLAPQPGDTVLDIGCGSGLNFAALQAAVGPDGTIIAVEESVELLSVAAARVTRRGWDNVELINAPVATARLAVHADAALCAAAHEVVVWPGAVANIFAHLREGAAVAAGGWKWPTRWLWPLRAVVMTLHHPCLSDLTGLEQPWRLLAQRRPELRVSELGFGTGYLAHAPAVPRRLRWGGHDDERARLSESSAAPAPGAPRA